MVNEEIRSKAWAVAKPVALVEWEKGSADTTQMLIACSRALDAALESVLTSSGQPLFGQPAHEAAEIINATGA